jgi:competence protein ComEC
MQSWMIGLVSGIVFIGFCPTLPPWTLSGVFAGIAITARPWRYPLRALTAGLACGCALGLAYGSVLLQQRIADDCVSLPITVVGTVSSLPTSSAMPGGGKRQRFEFDVEQLSPSRCSGPQQLMLSYYGEHRVDAGAKWQFEVKLKKPWGLANPGVYNMQAWFAQKGIDAVGSVRSAGAAHELPSSPRVLATANKLRQKISRHVERLDLDPDVTAVLRAVTVADSSGIDSHLWFLFQQFGLNHLLVISGLHVGMVAAVGYLLGGLCLRVLSPVLTNACWLPGIFALLLAGVYAALAGFSLPVQRALCMLACFVFAGLMGRQSDSTRSFLLAASVVLVLSPLAATGSGFWLSFGAVAALLWFTRWQRGLGSFIRLLKTQTHMSLVMLPLGALFFGGGSLAALLANLLMIPLIGMVVVPVALAAVACFLCDWSIGSYLWLLASWPLAKLMPLAAQLADSAGAWLYVPLTASIKEALLGLLAVALLATPGRAVLKPLALLLAVPLFLPINTAKISASNSTRVTVLDVGQGTAVVVRSGHQTLLYDTGGGDPNGVNMGSLVVLPYLHGQRITALDTLVISHADLDHSAGLGAVEAALPITRFRYGGQLNRSGPEVVRGRPCVAGESWSWPGGQVFQFLSPAQETPKLRNDSSCVLQIQLGDHRLLLTGDIEKDRERMVARYWDEQLASDWLMAAHHGSQTSTATTFLKVVQPRVVVISNGYANRFGHPHFTVTERLDHFNVKILATATGGALDFVFTPGESVRISTYRQFERRYWM